MISSPPVLSPWQQQLAGLLPLSSLIEFIDLTTKLHIFQLNGSVPLWNWPVTPIGARLLLSNEDNSTACCLDHSDGSAVLHCIDGRYGDWYPCSTPSTTRLCISAQKANAMIRNLSPNMADAKARRQKLDIIYLAHATSKFVEDVCGMAIP